MPSWSDVAQIAGTVGGLAFAILSSGKAAKATALWLKRRREERHARMRANRTTPAETPSGKPPPSP